MQKEKVKKIITLIVSLLFFWGGVRFSYLYAKIESNVVTLLMLVDIYEDKTNSKLTNTRATTAFVSNLNILKARKSGLAGSAVFRLVLMANDTRGKAFSTRIERIYF